MTNPYDGTIQGGTPRMGVFQVLHPCAISCRVRQMTARVAMALLFISCVSPVAGAEFQSDFARTHDRVWLGADYWANPMEDWRVHNGRAECVRGGNNRNVHLLTHWLKDDAGDFEVSVRLGLLTGNEKRGSAGFAVGVRDPDTGNHLSSLFFGNGLEAGITADGKLFLGSVRSPEGKPILSAPEDVRLTLTVKPHKAAYRLTLAAYDGATDAQLGTIAIDDVPADRLAGNLVLVNNHAGNRRPHVNGAGSGARFWFRDWQVSGTKVVADRAHRFGPILYAMHTLSRGVMKMTAQMPPIGPKESQSVRLQTATDDGWQTVAEAPIDPLSRTATFRIEDWDDTRDVAYRLSWTDIAADGSSQEAVFTGTVRKDPVDKPQIVIAGFTGNTDAGFPNELITGNVAAMNPDVLFFSGDQIYEQVGGYGIFRSPVPLATLNYLRKIYMWGFAFRDLLRDRPTLVLPDDHDVYQGNIWGQGGRDSGGIANHDRGGYAMPAEWVNAVERTQTAHHPDPFDPTPIEQNITVYYGDMLYGRVSFAVLEDRKFKSGPAGKVNSWPGRPDHVKDAELDPRTLDKPGLKLLGDRQLEFLRHWSRDWKGADMKLAVSQTIFCNLANYHGPSQQYIVADLDSNGWPQSGRNRALDALRRGFAFHYAGDQHLPSIVHHGIDTWGDAGFSFCVPSIAAGYPRSWRPDAEGRPVKNRPAGGLPNTGDYQDGFTNHVTVHAIGNPAETNRPGRTNTLHDKASGFGIVRMNKPAGTITMECYRLQIDANNLSDDDQFPGWPKTIQMMDNYARQAVAYLPEIKITGLTNPVVQVVNETSGEIEYTLRVRGTAFRPKVFDADVRYTLHVGDPDTDRMQMLENVAPLAADEEKTLSIAF